MPPRLPLRRLSLTDRCYELAGGDPLSALALAADATWAKLTPGQRRRQLEQARMVQNPPR